MIHMMGAALVAFGCCWLGEKKARQLAGRVRALEGLAAALGQMARELTLSLTPLPQLMRRLGEESAWPADSLFSRCGQALEGLDREPFSQAWSRLTREIPCLMEEDRRALAPLGQVLGRYGGGEQAAAIAAVEEELKQLHRSAQADSRRLGRVYRAVGAAGGGFLVILLL